MGNVVKIRKNKNVNPPSCNLSVYQNQTMVCPVTHSRQCYFIPLTEINGMSANPGRAGGTQQNHVTEIFESLITDPKGQEEPVCLEWNPATSEFDIVFGYNREWAVNDVYSKGFSVANHPNLGVAGIWAWVFTGTPHERKALQMRENGNKKPQSPATKDQMVNMLKQYIELGGLSIGYTPPFSSLDDKEKYNRARDFMKGNTPYWGGRKFKGVWNKLTQDGSSAVGLSYTTYSKKKIAEYFCNNNPYEIKAENLKAGYSGSVVEVDGVTYAVYFVNNKSEIAGALPTNASKCHQKNNVDHLILVGALNGSTTGLVESQRDSFEDDARYWRDNIYSCFDEVFWMPQTEKECDAHIMSGTWTRTTSL